MSISFAPQEFAENPEPRVACVLVLDVSGSMAGQKIADLNLGIKRYQSCLLEDSLAKKRVEICVVSFGTKVEIVNDFVTADNFHPTELIADGLTYMGKAVNLAVDLVEQRKQLYKQNGITYYRPWVILISDGEPNDPDWEASAARAVAAEKAKQLKMFCVGVDNANMETLGKFMDGTPLQLKGTDFGSLFQWLSNSQSSQSRSTPGTEVKLEDPTGPKGWATI